MAIEKDTICNPRISKMSVTEWPSRMKDHFPLKTLQRLHLTDLTFKILKI